MKYNPDDLQISINGSWYSIRIHKSIIRALGSPEYIGLRVNEAISSIAILPCQSTDFMSFRVPDDFVGTKKVDFKIYSKGFVTGILEKCRLNTNACYLIYGRHLENNNAIVFDVSKAKQIET